MCSKELYGSEALTYRKTDCSIRVYQKGRDRLYSIHDILSCCGIKAPDKWSRRNGGSLVKKRIPYPIKSSKGNRAVSMLFTDKASVLRILEDTACQSDIADWILVEVLQQERVEETKTAEISPQPPVRQQLLETDGLPELIDDAIMKLLLIKRACQSLKINGDVTS